METFEAIIEVSFGELETKIKEEKEEMKVYIGEENPFGKDKDLSLILAGIDGRGMVGILGPTRMDYRTNIAMVKKTKKLLSEKI